MPRVKVLSVITGLHVGGAERLLLTQMRCLDQRRFEPVVVTLVGGELIPEFERAGARVYDLRMRHQLDVGGAVRFWRILRAERPDVLHTHLFHADLIGRLLGRLAGVPAIVTTLHMLEEPANRWWCNPLSYWCSHLNSALIAISDEVKQDFLTTQGLDPAKIRIIPNAVEPIAPIDEARRAALRRQAGVPEGGMLVGAAARLELPRKGLHLLVDAISRLAPRYPGLRCVILGDGPGRPRLEEAIARFGMADRVTLLGTRHDVGDWLQAMDLFTLPSNEEGLPMCIIEAMGASRPVVSTTVGGIPELIDHERHGLLIPPESVDALTAALDRLLQQPETARRMGQEGLVRFTERYDMRRMIRHTEDLYLQLLRQCAAPATANGHAAPSANGHAASNGHAATAPAQRVKLLVVVTTLDPGGVTTHLDMWLRRLDRRRFDAEVACGPDDLQREVVARWGVPVHIVNLHKPVNPLQDLHALGQLWRIMRRRRIQLVHTHMDKASFLGALAGRLAGVECVVATAHGPTKLTRTASSKQRFLEGMAQLTYGRLAHGAIGVSRATTRDLLIHTQCRPEMIQMVANAVEAPADGPSRDAVRASLGLLPEQPVLIMVGRLVPQKAQETLIEAMPAVLAQRPDVVCLIVGDGPRQQELTQQARALGLERHVRFLGRRNDVPNLLRASDVFVLATNYEGMSVSVLEAMACALPVVASRVDGMDELVTDGVTGLLVAPRDPKALAEALALVAIDPTRRRAMGKAAFARMQADFNATLQAIRTEDALLRALRLRQQVRGRQCPSSSSANPSGLERLRRHLQEEGLASTIHRLAFHALKPVFGAEQYWLVERSLEEPIVQIPAKLPCEVRMAGPQDLDLLAAVGFYSREFLRRLLTSPMDACFIAVGEGRVIGFQWVALGPRRQDLAPLPWPVHLAADEAYLYNSRALKAYRGQGIVFAIGACALGWLRARGVRRAYAMIRSWNTPSLALFDKLGFRRIERATLRRLGPSVQLRAHRLRAVGREPVRLLVIGDEVGQESSAVERLRHTDEFSVIRLHHSPSIRRTARGAQDLWLPRRYGPWSWLRGWAFCYRVIRRERIDVVHAQNASALWLGALAARLAGAGHIMVSLTRWPLAAQGPVRWALRRLLAGCDRVLVADASLRRDLVRGGWLADSAITPLQTAQARPLSDRLAALQEARRRLGLEAEGPVIGTAARLVPDMAPWRFVELCRALEADRPGCRFVIVGDGPLFALTKRYAEQLGIGHRTVFVRQASDPRLILDAADVIIDLSNGRGSAGWDALTSLKPIVPLSQSVVEVGQAAKSVARMLGGPPPAFSIRPMGHHAAAYALSLQLADIWQTLVESDLTSVAPTRWACRDGQAAFARAS